MINSILDILNIIFSNYYFLFSIVLLAFTIKWYLLYTLIKSGLSQKIQRPWPWICLILVLVGSIIEDVYWIVKILQIISDTFLEPQIKMFFAHFSWAFFIIQYQSLSLFIESLTEKNFKLLLRQKLFLLISLIFSGSFFYFAFYHLLFANNSPVTDFEIALFEYGAIYIFIMIFPSLFASVKKILNSDIPKILKKQSKFLIIGLICPRILTDLFQVYPFNLAKSVGNNYMVVGITTILVALAALYCTQRVLRLRFLNIKRHVQSSKKFNFINNFKDILEQLSHTTTTYELVNLTKTFFKEHLQIQPSRTYLFVRMLNKQDDYETYENKMEINKSKKNVVENFINNQSNLELLEFLKQTKILIYDEIEFSEFYETNEVGNNIIHFLDQINADVFIPIYKKETIVAYVIVERDPRNDQIYNNIERDEMVVFTSYLGNIINLLQNRNLETLIKQEKEIKEELYYKHQEINQYKESIRSFLKRAQQNKKIGILFYKNRKFIFANQDAKELINFNINTQEGHPLAQDLRRLAKEVEEYKSPQSCFTKDSNGSKLVVTAIANLEYNNLIITIHYPDISDIIKQQIDLLKDPSKWDYLLYLETTKSGQLINQLVPGSGENLLNFKINLLKLALTKKATLLEMPEEDLISTVEIIHHISLRENLHTLKLQAPTKNFDIATKLFGINPIYDKTDTKPILQKLSNNGTLFIQNIHLMDIEIQEYLAEFIKYGFYHIYKSDQKLLADVRIICSTNQNLNHLVQEGKFSKSLYDELKKTSISMPSLLSLSEEELKDLAQGFTDQATKSNAFKNILELTDKEKVNLINKRPVSLQEFKEKVHYILTEKSKKNNIYQETQFNPAYNIADPSLIEAARLGKHALKDPKILALLWDKFKNQNKIATFLGVNRSSVHRRCKEYSIIKDE
ncbi:MAG: sigma 54-interacting transcriptional regulator [Candidatus Babeliales bacterium]|nr:sigma 54-interacting transcriptional regulator [Candidatus Babeliales bacterium]